MKNKSSFKKKIKEMKQNDKGKAILKLIRWIIFFLFIMIFCIISSIITKNRPIEKENNKKPVINNPIKKEENNTKDLKDYLTLLSDSNINYTYKINSSNLVYTFKGTVTNNIEEGYKESASNIIKYYIVEDEIYQEVLDNRIPISNLYEDLNQDYLNVKKLVSHLSNLNFTKIDDTYKATNNNLNYEINIKNEEINNIIIIGNDLEYILSYEVQK